MPYLISKSHILNSARWGALILGVVICSVPLVDASGVEGPPAGTLLRVGFGGFAGSECVQRTADVEIAGSQSEVVVEFVDKSGTSTDDSVLDDPVPEMLLEFGLRLPASDSVAYLQELGQRLSPTLYTTPGQVRADSIRRLDIPIPDRLARKAYHFMLTLPSDLAGEYLCVRVSVDDPVHGQLHGSRCINVVNPCSERDENQVRGTMIWRAAQFRDHMRVIALTDSLLACGWSWWPGLQIAVASAQATGDFERQLAYLDAQYHLCGHVTPLPGRDRIEEEREYLLRRARIMERMTQQQQR